MTASGWEAILAIASSTAIVRSQASLEVKRPNCYLYNSFKVLIQELQGSNVLSAFPGGASGLTLLRCGQGE